MRHLTFKKRGRAQQKKSHDTQMRANKKDELTCSDSNDNENTFIYLTQLNGIQSSQLRDFWDDNHHVNKKDYNSSQQHSNGVTSSSCNDVTSDHQCSHLNSPVDDGSAICIRL